MEAYGTGNMIDVMAFNATAIGNIAQGFQK